MSNSWIAKKKKKKKKILPGEGDLNRQQDVQD